MLRRLKWSLDSENVVVNALLCFGGILLRDHLFGYKCCAHFVSPCFRSYRRLGKTIQRSHTELLVASHPVRKNVDPNSAPAQLNIHKLGVDSYRYLLSTQKS